ncbi:MAG: 4-hydroxybenzoate octaprenyltransferase [Pseudomonadota bacterium]
MTREQLKNYCYLLRLHKPVGILLLLWPTLWALWLASDGKPDWRIVAIFVVGVIVMRSAGCVINDIADRNIDGQVARTKMRPLATGAISVPTALIIFLLLSLVGFLLVLMLNPLTIYLALVGAVLMVTYPFLKRVTHLPQVGLGLAFAWGVPMAFAAVTHNVPAEAWLLFGAAVLWPISYDTIYALVDKADDMAFGIKSTAVLFDDKSTVFIATFQVAFLLLMTYVGWVFDLNIFYYVGLLAAEGLFAYQQFLMKDGEPRACFEAFLNNQWVGLLVFLGIIMNYLI